MNLINPWSAVALLTVALFGGGILLTGSQALPNEAEEAIDTTVHIKGNPDAQVRLVEYSDFACPACASFQPVLDELIARLGDKLAIEYKHFPLQGNQAAIAAEAAGQQGQFFAFHDLLYERQTEWAPALSKQKFFVNYAEEIGLDIELFNQHLKSNTLQRKVIADRQEGVSLVDNEGKPLIEGTPTFFLNGEKMRYSTFEEFATQVILAVDPNAVANTTEGLSEVNTSDVRFGF